jgi:hypothetical protein
VEVSEASLQLVGEQEARCSGSDTDYSYVSLRMDGCISTPFHIGSAAPVLWFVEERQNTVGHFKHSRAAELDEILDRVRDVKDIREREQHRRCTDALYVSDTFPATN